MSTILLPAVRRDTVNLFSYTTAGLVDSSSGGSGSASNPFDGAINIADIGLVGGDVVSCSAEIKNDVSGESTRISLVARDAGGALIQASTSVYGNNTDWTQHTRTAFTLPANTASLVLEVHRQSGSGTFSLRKGMINRGATAQAFDIPKRGAWAPIVHAMLARDNDQSVQRYLSGASQITSYPSRRWMLQFATHVLEGDELREWSLALDQLSDLGNVFRFTPPEYEGPSTGYEGPMPAVNGASQTGTSLVCDGVTASTDILGPGDYVSFEVTTAKSNTNVELHRIASLAMSDASGNVTLTFTRPIRQAPADNAVIQCYAPTAQFRFVAPRAGTDLQLMRRTPISVEAEEAIGL